MVIAAAAAVFFLMSSGAETADLSTDCDPGDADCLPMNSLTASLELDMDISSIAEGTPGLENLHAPEPWRAAPEAGRMATAYELEWQALGHPFHFFRHRRRP